jgi:hypothetical protein
MTIHDLNTALNQHGLTLINMGSYDGQTLASVISTSTHGSGIKRGAFPSAIEALVIKADGQVIQIGPSNGITNPTKFATQAGNVQFIQNDKFYYASAIGSGSLGIQAVSLPPPLHPDIGFMAEPRRALVSALTDKQLRRERHRSTKEHEDHIRSFIYHHNHHPKPFMRVLRRNSGCQTDSRWVKSMGEQKNNPDHSFIK